MARDLSEDKRFAEQVSRDIAERTIVNFIVGLRLAKGLSQGDIAAKMGCTQSRISRLENGKDGDLRIGDFRAYTDALGLEMAVVLTKGGRTLAGDIKAHLAAITRLLARLMELVGDDQTMAKGAWEMVAEITKVLSDGVVKAAKQLPPLPRRTPSPSIQVEVQAEEGEDAEGDPEDPPKIVTATTGGEMIVG